MPRQHPSRALLRLSVAFAPALLCGALGWAVMEGWLGFGGGEKDIFLLMPLALWSLLFGLASLVLWALGMALGRTIWVAALAGLVLAVAVMAPLVFGLTS